MSDEIVTPNNAWIHRISYYGGIAYPLAEQGILTIGFSDTASESPDIGARLQNECSLGNAMAELAKYGRSRWSLCRFAQMCKGDWVVVPRPYAFDVYRVLDDQMKPIPNLPLDNVSLKGVSRNDGKWLATDAEPNGVDLGFYREVEPVETNIPRDGYANEPLRLRLKCRQTTLKINDLMADVRRAVEDFRKSGGATRDQVTQLKECLAQGLMGYIRDKCSDDHFEDLVLAYTRAIGADEAVKPSKRISPIPGTEKVGDIDVLATFSALNVVLLIQVKHHHVGTITDASCVNQVASAAEAFEKNAEYANFVLLKWCISAADDFDSGAVQAAKENDVTLINREEFLSRYIDAIPEIFG